MIEVPFRYEVAALPAEEGGGFVAVAPDLPGCMSDGGTVDEALTNLLDAAKGWVAEAQAAGFDLPAMRMVA